MNLRLRDRILMTIGIWISALPFILVGVSMHFLPKNIPVFDMIINPSLDHLSKYNNLFTGLLCVLPLAAVLIASNLKRRNIMNRNFIVMVSTAIGLSGIFTGLVLYGLIVQARMVPDLLLRFDFMGITALGFCAVSSFLGVFLPELIQNEFLGIKNKRTLEDPQVWKTVNTKCSYIMIYLFFVLGVICAFIRKFWALGLALGGMVLFILFTFAYSDYIAKKVKEQRELMKKERDEANMGQRKLMNNQSDEVKTKLDK